MPSCRLFDFLVESGAINLSEEDGRPASHGEANKFGVTMQGTQNKHFYNPPRHSRVSVCGEVIIKIKNVEVVKVPKSIFIRCELCSLSCAGSRP